MSLFCDQIWNYGPEIRRLPAISFNGRVHSYEDLKHDIEELFRSVGRNAPDADIVFWYGRDYYTLVCLFFACLRAGKALVPAADPGCPQFAELTNAAAVYHENHCLRAGRKSPAPLGAGLLLPTSGSTGEAKLAWLPERMLWRNTVEAAGIQELAPQDTVLAFSRLSHTGGWNINLLPGLASGAHVRLLGEFTPYAAFRLLGSFSRIKTHLSPAQLNLLFSLKEWPAADLSRVELLVTGSSEVRPYISELLLKKGVRQVIRNYGLTEAGPFVLYGQAFSATEDLESLSRLAGGFRMLLDDENRLLLSGEAVFGGYLRKDGLEERKGPWLNTGDLFIKKKNQLFFAGRVEDRIPVAEGAPLYPSQVESQIIRALPEIRECGLTQNSDGGLTLFYGGRPEAGPFAETPLALVAQKAAGQPVRLVHRRFLPRNLNGKLDRPRLKSEASC